MEGLCNAVLDVWVQRGTTGRISEETKISNQNKHSVNAVAMQAAHLQLQYATTIKVVAYREGSLKGSKGRHPKILWCPY